MHLSIILPVYNSHKHIDRIRTTLAPFFNKRLTEIIIVDDASSDGIVISIENLIKEYDINNIIFLNNHKNEGPAYSRNQGLKIAKGEYIAFLDSDDAWHASKIEFQIEQMKKYNVPICGTVHSILAEEKLESQRIKAISKNIEIEKIKWPSILFKTPFATPSVIIHNSIKHYLFNEKLKYAEDYNLWLRIVHDFPAIKIKYPLTFTFKHNYLTKEESLSSNLWLMQKGNIHNFLGLLSEHSYSFSDKFLIIAALLFSYIKFIKRGVTKLIATIIEKKDKIYRKC
ncbi:MAG: glycosyltransferase family 2 protein [Pseudomonadota bacterium]